MLTREQTAAYDEAGYLVLDGFKSPREISALRARAAAIVEGFDPAEAGVFTTRDQGKRTDRYFLESGDKIRCFLEEEATAPGGGLLRPKALAVNKIGHALHDRDPVFDRFSRDPRLAAVASGIGLARPLLWQSMYIFKQPGIGGEVRWHQDASFFVTEPVTVTTFWFALEDADRSNGCLWVEPGGHRGTLRERFVRDGEATRFEPLDPAPWPAPWPTETTAMPVEVRAGALVVFHGLLPHYSAPNRSPVSRHAYTLHATDAGAAYSPRNWLQRDPSFPPRGFGPPPRAGSR